MDKNLLKRVRKNRFGSFELKVKPSPKELLQYYQDKYYEQSKGTYQRSYSKDEILFFKNKLHEKYLILEEIFGPERGQRKELTGRRPKNRESGAPRRFLDIGCGEGWALDFFRKKGWLVLGLDFSESGAKMHNSHCLPFICKGNIYEEIESLLKEKRRFEVIFMEHTLEHVLDPLKLLRDAKKLLTAGGVMVVEVPNDFSTLQLHLLKKGFIKRPFWVVIPDHISYFNKKGLEALSRSAGLKAVRFSADFPIDMNLLNENTNYVECRDKGKSAHRARLEIENLMYKISPQKTNRVYEALADLGLGRNLICFIKRK